MYDFVYKHDIHIITTAVKLYCTIRCVFQHFHLFKLVRLVKVRDFPTGEDVIDVLKEGLLNDLRVSEEEHSGLVLHPHLVVELVDICSS